MDKRLRKYMLYKASAKTQNQARKELAMLEKKREEMRQDLIDSSPEYMYGQPRGKVGTADPTQRKALKLIDIDKRINTLRLEQQVFTKLEKEILSCNEIQRKVYEETIKKECLSLDAKAYELHMGRRQLTLRRAKILKYIAQELGEYIDAEELEC